jgi:hypothetical protein
MESLDNKSKSIFGFFKYVLNVDEDSKSDILNIIQYSIISIVPIVILNKSMQKYIPEADEKKGSVEILAEIMFQIIYIFIGLLLAHRIVTYIPTYSGIKYPEFNIIFVILAVLMITMSLQTKLGDKISIITDRVVELWEGKPEPKQPKQQVAGLLPSYQEKKTNYTDGTSISQLPTNNVSSSYQPNLNTDNLPNYNESKKQEKLPDLSSQLNNNYLNNDNAGIMAASDALGGSFSSFSSW